MNATSRKTLVLILALVVVLIGIVLAIIASTGWFAGKETPSGQGATPPSETSQSAPASEGAATAQPGGEESSVSTLQPIPPAEPGGAPAGDPASATATPAPPPTPPAAKVAGIPAKEPDGSRPAPAGVMWKDSYAFLSPTRNIYCEMGPDVVSCGIFQRDYQPPMPCENAFHMVELFADSGSMREDCHIGNPAPSTEVLAYGMSACTGNLTCLSQETGVACWNNLLGSGFLLNRDGITKY